MGNTFLLKTALGEIAGFLVQNDKNIVYKLDQKTGDAIEIVLRLDDGTLEHKRIAPDGKEGTLHSAGKKIKGVAVTAPNEEVILRAGERFPMPDSNIQVRINMPSKKEKTDTNVQKGKNESQSDMKHLQQKETMINENQWPQRRWPPPPCMHSAAYYHGRWQDEV